MQFYSQYLTGAWPVNDIIVKFQARPLQAYTSLHQPDGLC